MTLRLTKRVADKLKIKLSGNSVYELDPLKEWYGHLFTANRFQYIILTNAYSLYSSIISAKGVLTLKDFIDTNFSRLFEALENDGIEMGKYITPNTEMINVCKTNNRGILGSMNDMINQSKFFLTEYNLSTMEISIRLNEAIYSYIKYERPKEIIKQLTLNKIINKFK